MVDASQAIETLRPWSFDVICAGEPLWRASIPALAGRPRAAGPAFINVTKMLTASGLRVGWAAVLEDDRRGRALLAEMAAIDVEVGAVRFAPAVGADLVVIDASGPVFDRARTIQVEVPASWSSQVLLLSGLRPVTSSLAAHCKAARRARRDGTAIVLDLVGSLREWSGHDPRMISAVLREADVVCCSLLDLAVIGTDTTTVRQTMRSNATLVLDEGGGATAVGTFGVVSVPTSRESSTAEVVADSYAAAVCLEYARPRMVAETPAGRWHRILRHEAPRLTDSASLGRRPARRGR